MTTVAYVGNFRHAHCTEVHLARTLNALGCTVIPLQEDEQTPGSIEREAIDAEADLVLYTRTWGMPPSLVDVWRRLERRGIVTASYHLDLYLGLKREATLAGDPFWATQYVFTPDGDPASEARFKALGINHHWSPPAAMHDECVPGTPRPEFAHDVIFVGSGRYPHPEWRYREELVHWIRQEYSGRFGHYGGDGIRVVRDRDLNDLYASAKCAVGDSLCPGFTKPNYWSDRVTETLGRGGVLIQPDVPGLRDYMGLIGGVHCLFYEYGDYEALRSHIEFCLADPEAARFMAEQGQAKIRAHHTYLHRLARALHTMGLRDSPEAPQLAVFGFASGEMVAP